MIKLLILLLLLMLHNAAAAPVVIEYFFQSGCGECQQVHELTLPLLQTRFPGQYELRQYNINCEENFLLLMERLDSLQIDANDAVCMIVGGKQYLGGFADIDSRLPDLIEQELQHPGAVPPPAAAAGRERLRHRAATFTVGTVAVAGLLDGFNPCVFSSLVFLMSLLTVSGIRRGRLLAVGGAYCLGCFITYIALGFGFFHTLKPLTGHMVLRDGINWLLTGVLILFAGLSFRDALRFHQTGRARNMVLQLPDRLRNRIHFIMRRGLKFRYLLPGSLGIAGLATLLESACTGQVYVPTLVLLARETGEGTHWIPLLLLYNIMFILPLVGLFLTLWRGTSLSVFLRWSRNNVVPTKISLGCFFLCMAVLLLL